jgi:hypothetical protein
MVSLGENRVAMEMAHRDDELPGCRWEGYELRSLRWLRSVVSQGN